MRARKSASSPHVTSTDIARYDVYVITNSHVVVGDVCYHDGNGVVIIGISRASIGFASPAWSFIIMPVVTYSRFARRLADYDDKAQVEEKTRLRLQKAYRLRQYQTLVITLLRITFGTRRR